MIELSFVEWLGLACGLLLLWRLECSSRAGRVCADDGVITIRVEVR